MRSDSSAGVEREKRELTLASEWPSRLAGCPEYCEHPGSREEPSRAV